MSDLPAATAPTTVPIAVPLTIAVVALWPLAVLLCTWLALVLLRPRTTRRPGRRARPAPSIDAASIDTTPIDAVASDRG